MKHRVGDHTVMEYSKVTPRIYLGTNACCLRHFNTKLLKRGVTADISLEAERVDAPQGVDFFLWLPTEDHTAPTQTDLDLGTQTIDWFIRHRQTVYVHCQNGHGRSPTLVAAYLIRYRSLTPARAVATIKKRRPEIHLEPSQLASLQRFAKRFRL